MTNTIPQAQVSDRALQQLRARQAVYASATWIQVVQLLVTVAFPVAAAIVGLTWRPHL